MSWFKSRAVQVYIEPSANQKMKALIDKCNGEVGWFGLVDSIEIRHGLQFDRIYDIVVPKQEVSVVSVDHEGFDLNDFLESHEEHAHEMKFYGHSHVHGRCYPSGVDLNQIREWGEYGVPYIISHIQNKFGEMYTRLDQFEPRRITAPVKLVELLTPDTHVWADQIIKENVYELTKEEVEEREKKARKHHASRGGGWFGGGY